VSRPKVLVVGSSNTDLIVKVPHIPKPGETILAGEFSTAAGGKGANQAVAAARAGGAVTFIARVGRDANGDRALSGFVDAGIDVSRVVRDRTRPSGVALIFVGEHGDNSIAVASGANGALSPADVRNASSSFRRASMLLLQLETPLKTIETSIDLAARAGVPVVLNPAPARPLASRLLARVHVLTPNETEAALLTGIAVRDENSAARAADALLAQGVGHVVITMGARGAFVASVGIRQMIRGFKAKAVDATGAGDVFNGALGVALAEGKPFLEAARFANAAAAISVTRLGAQPSAPARREIDRLLATGRLGRRRVR
jgi:ribokinase